MAADATDNADTAAGRLDRLADEPVDHRFKALPRTPKPRA